MFHVSPAYVSAEYTYTLSQSDLKNSDTFVIDDKNEILYYHYPNNSLMDDYKMMLNACYIRDNLSNIESTFTTDSGEKVTVGKWTLNAICGMLGNISVESMVNPGSWQNGENSDEGGFGLTHWSPPYDKQKYIFWARKNYENADATLWNMDWQLEYIRYEVYRDIIGKNGYQWHSTLYGAGMSFEEFIQSELSVEKLAEVFVRAYEKPLALIEGIKTGDSARVENCIKGRQLFAKMWKDFFDKKSLYADNRLW